MHKGITRDKKLAVTPPESARKSSRAEQLKNTGIVDDHKQGRRGYVELAIKQGVYKSIGAFILSERHKNKDLTYKAIYPLLHERFPNIFTKSWMHESNVSKMINGDKFWSAAWFFNREELLCEAELNVKEILDTETDSKTLLIAYDKINKYDIERTKLDIEKQKLELLKQNSTLNNNDDNNVNISIEW